MHNLIRCLKILASSSIQPSSHLLHGQLAGLVAHVTKDIQEEEGAH